MCVSATITLQTCNKRIIIYSHNFQFSFQSYIHTHTSLNGSRIARPNIHTMMDNLLNDNIDDFDLDLLDNSFRSLIGGFDTTIGTPSDDPLKSSFTSKSSIDLERMFLEMDNEDPEQLLESMMDSYNPTRCSTTDHRCRSGSIIKDELLLDDVNYDPIPYAPVNLGLGPKKRKTREDYKNSRRASCSDAMGAFNARRVSCSDMDNYEHFFECGDQPSQAQEPLEDNTMCCPPPFSKSARRHKVTPPRRATVETSAPTMSQLFGGGAGQTMHHHHQHTSDSCHNMAGLFHLEQPATTVSSSSTFTPPTPPKNVSAGTTEYHDALQKLAASMKRTELSRRQVIGSSGNQVENYQAKCVRSSLYSTIETQLEYSSPSKSTSGNVSPTNVTTLHPLTRGGTMDISTRMEDFFNGKRGTLTQGLEDSRLKLRMYAAAAATSSARASPSVY